MRAAGKSNPGGVRTKLSNLKKRDYIVGDPEDIFHIDWLAEWNELKNLEPLPEDLDKDTNPEV